MNDNFDMNGFLKEIDQDIKKRLDNISPDILKAIMHRSFHDAKELYAEEKERDFKKLVYVIYRSYILGMQLEKTYNKVKLKKHPNKTVYFKAE